MSHSVHRLHMASLTDPAAVWNDYVESRIELYAYLVIGNSDVLLIDTGVGRGNAFIERTNAPGRTPIDRELARFGVESPDVKLIVNSHLHFDHCGNNQLFPDAEIYVQARELMVARTPRYNPDGCTGPINDYTVLAWFDYDGARLNSVSGDLELCDGIRLIETPGHTPGHQSILVTTANGTVLVAAQAAFTAREYQCGGDVRQAHNGMEKQYLESITKLKSLGADEVYFSHDMTSVREDQKRIK